MQRNNIYLRSFIIGIISISSLCCTKKVQPARFGEFYFVNNTSHIITYEYKNSVGNQGTLNKYNIQPNNTTYVEQTQESGQTVDAADFYAPFYKDYDFRFPLTVKFDNTNCGDATTDSEHSPLNIKNYVAEKLGERKYKFTFIFTEADYNKAVACP